MGAQAGGLPSAYQQVEYIEANAGPLIDTEKFAKLNTKIVCGMQRMDSGTSGYPALFGCANPNLIISVQGASTNAYASFGNAGEKTLSNCPMRNSIHDIVMDKNGVTVDGVSKATYTATSLTEDSNVHIGIFGRYKGGAALMASVWARCSYFKIYENDDLVCDLVPCYRKSDSVIGMYDLVAKAFRTNANTGSLAKGADV